MTGCEFRYTLSMASEYFLISDLHLGGDAAIDECDFEEELLGFLRSLEEYAQTREKPAEVQQAVTPETDELELIIVGDAFGFWELTEKEGTDKLPHIISRHTEIFEQLRRTGEKLRITIMAGNHDHDLVCYPEFRYLLAEYNMQLESRYAVTRRCAGRDIWIEHGNQHDEYNRIERWGDPHAKPPGYFITERLVSSANRKSRLGKEDWLRDLESVSPSENVPNWMLSNYFYREMHPLIRNILVPFLLLTGISLLILIGSLLEEFGLIPTAFFRDEIMYRPPVFGAAFRYFVTINLAAVFVVALVAIPASVIIRDFRRTLERYELRFTAKKGEEKDRRYLTAARRVFAEHPEVAVFVYGHTHVGSLSRVDGRLVVNTGTWLKRLHRIRSKLTLLPDVYYPSFRIGYYHIHSETDATGDENIVVKHRAIPKTAPNDLSWVQRLICFGKDKIGAPPIPDRTVISSHPEKKRKSMRRRKRHS